MKTYSEKKGKKPFNWFEALSKDVKEMKLNEIEDLLNKSKDWVTCACGNQCSVIDRKDDGAPLDEKLKDLGTDFYVFIKDMHEKISTYDSFYNAGESQVTVKEMIEEKWLIKEVNKCRLKALSTLEKIEKRSTIVIQNKIKEIKDALGQDKL